MPVQLYPKATVAPAAPPATAHPAVTIPHQPSYRAPTDRIFYMEHLCQPACLNRVRPAKRDMHRGKNPLLIPLLYDFRRMTGRRKVNRKVSPTWRAMPRRLPPIGAERVRILPHCR